MKIFFIDYKYNAFVIDIYDGDYITCLVDLGFGILYFLFITFDYK